MVSSNVENLGGYGGGFGFGGGGGCGILGFIALASIFKDHFGRGDRNGCNECLAAMQNQIGDLRHEVGDVKFDQVNATLNQTIGLMNQINAGNMDATKTMFGLSQQLCAEAACLGKEVHQVDRDVLENRHILDKDIVVMGLKNELNNCQQTNYLSKQISDCCCEEKGLITATAHETQIRDLMYKCDTDKELAKILCGQEKLSAEIKESRLLGENCALKEKVEAQREALFAQRIAGEVAKYGNKSVNATLAHWGADRSFNGDTYPNPPYGWPFA